MTSPVPRSMSSPTPSAYTEKRDQYGVGFEYLHSDTLMTVGYSNSTENDYEANTYDIGVSQDFFGGMSTLSMGFTPR